MRAREDLIKQIIAEWLGEKVLPPLISREIGNVELESASEILAIVGPRRAGKTYLMYQMVKRLLDESGYQRNDILFVDFEDYRLMDVSPDDIEIILSAHNQLAGKYPGYIFFDEIQHLPGWERVLRTLHNQGKYRIIVSGSNSQLLSQEISSSLRGRYRDLLLLPFSWRESLNYAGIEYSEIIARTPARGRILRAFDHYLREGGFPEVLKETTLQGKKQILRRYYRTLFYRDIIERYNVKAKHILENMMGYCLDTYSVLFSISAFEKYLAGCGLPASKRTISNYLFYLREAFFLIAHEKFSFSPRKRMMNPKKIYLLDTGLSALSTEFSENKGRILENAVAIEMFRRGQEAYYFKGRYECDFVVKRNRKPVRAIQVCWEITSRNKERELRGLAEAMNDFNISAGLILTYNQEAKLTYENRRISVVPAWKWLLTTDHLGC